MKQQMPKISVIIPVLNEEAIIASTLQHLWQNSSKEHIKEILVVDGGSTDATCAIAKKHGANVISSARGRAKQMNCGAKNARGSILYFLHADTLPPKHFDQSILKSVKNNCEAGCFQMRFDSNSLFLQIFAWFSRINAKLCRGGDQSLFTTKEIFEELNGFNEAYQIYEDNEFIGRLYEHTPFKVLPHFVKTSARKYEKHGELKLQYHFGIIHLKKRFGASPDELYDYYLEHIN